MKYKDRKTLLRSDVDDLSEIEVAEFKLIAREEVDGILARLGNSSKDFKHTVALELYRRLS